VSLLATGGMVAIFKGDLEGRALVEEALVLAMAYHDDVGAARAHHILGEAWHEDLGAGIHHLATAAELVRRHGLTDPEAFYAALSGYLLAEAGDWEAAERRIADAEALAGASEHGEWTRWSGRCASASVALGRGELEDALEGFAGLTASSLCRQSPNHNIWAHTCCGSALLLLGRAEEALAEVEPFLASFESLVAGHREETVVVGVGALVASGRLDEAARLAARVASARTKAYLADYARGLSALDAAAIEGAAARADAHGARLDGARLRATAATVLATRPETRAAAADLARAAHQRFQALGSEAWCRRLEGQLRTLGRRAPTPSRAGAGGLSSRELEVLGLVADGLTNREIAERLVISQNTAIRHVANIFAKLGAGSRAQAVRLAAERGLIDLSPGAAVSIANRSLRPAEPVAARAPVR
jgi:DNA-binding NarL/FixJ family response regulator